MWQEYIIFVAVVSVSRFTYHFFDKWPRLPSGLFIFHNVKYRLLQKTFVRIFAHVKINAYICNIKKQEVGATL